MTAVTDTARTGRGFARLSLMRLTWPLLALTVVTLLATLGNTVVLSLADPDLNAAVATANQILGVLYDVSVLFSIGALVVVAQLLGAGSESRARRAAVMSLRASTVLGLAIGVSVAAAGPAVVTWINTPQEIVGDARAYLWVAAGAMVFNAMIVAGTAVLRAYGKTVLLLVLGLIVNVIDVPLLFVCVFLLDLGAVGAAVPSLVIRGVAIVVLLWFIRRHTGVSMFARLPADDAGDRSIGPWRQARLSIPTVVQNGLYNVAILLTVSFVNVLGSDAINARSYALTLTALVTGVILALVQGNETLVGWDMGENKRRDARQRTLRTALWTALATAVLAAGLWAAGAVALGIFGASSAVVDSARDLLLISVLLLPLSAITGILFGALRSTGDVVIPMIYTVGSTVLVMLPLSWFLVAHLEVGLAGAFWALVAGEAVAATLLTARWLRGAWETIPSVDEKVNDAEALV